jgi:hypothetical protein
MKALNDNVFVNNVFYTIRLEIYDITKENPYMNYKELLSHAITENYFKLEIPGEQDNVPVEILSSERVVLNNNENYNKNRNIYKEKYFINKVSNMLYVYTLDGKFNLTTARKIAQIEILNKYKLYPLSLRDTNIIPNLQDSEIDEIDNAIGPLTGNMHPVQYFKCGTTGDKGNIYIKLDIFIKRSLIKNEVDGYYTTDHDINFLSLRENQTVLNFTSTNSEVIRKGSKIILSFKNCLHYKEAYDQIISQLKCMSDEQYAVILIFKKKEADTELFDFEEASKCFTEIRNKCSLLIYTITGLNFLGVRLGSEINLLAEVGTITDGVLILLILGKCFNKHDVCEIYNRRP